MNDKFDVFINQYNKKDRYPMDIKINDELWYRNIKLFIILVRMKAQLKGEATENSLQKFLLGLKEK